MKRGLEGKLVFSPSDLITYYKSPFASWMDRYYLDGGGNVKPDLQSAAEKLIAETGQKHEATVLHALAESEPGLANAQRDNWDTAAQITIEAINSGAPIIYQAALESGCFAGLADFLILGQDNEYQVWDTKLARLPKPYYAIQLCCYSEMLAAVTGGAMPAKFGIILGAQNRVEFRLEDFVYFYQQLKQSFLRMQGSFTGQLSDRPQPTPHGDHGRWGSLADAYYIQTDSLVQVANITSGQIKKLHNAGICSMQELADARHLEVRKMAAETQSKLVSQARLQCATRAERVSNPEAMPLYELLEAIGPNGEPVGLATLPQPDSADVYFDMEGYPLTPGGLEYLFGVTTIESDKPMFRCWWAHDRPEEKRAFEEFIDYSYAIWRANPGMHIYHYAPYEVSAVRRLSTRHDTRQDEVDDLLRNEVFVDLYRIICRGIRIGAENYSIKTVERLYRAKRKTEVANAVDSIVQYARYIESGEGRDEASSPILNEIKEYNEDDCNSTAELAAWLRSVALQNGIAIGQRQSKPKAEQNDAKPEIAARVDLASELRALNTEVSRTLSDLIDFHRRENKPVWWRMYDRAGALPAELRDDPACIEGIKKIGNPESEARSQVQKYRFDPEQEIKLSAGEGKTVKFAHNIRATIHLIAIDLKAGRLTLKASNKTLNDNCDGIFPDCGSLIAFEYVDPREIPGALADVASGSLAGRLHPPVEALLTRKSPVGLPQSQDETHIDAAIRIANEMNGDCLVIQGPPGTGKTYTAARTIIALLARGKRVGITSNSHKAIVTLMNECAVAAEESHELLVGLKVGDTDNWPGPLTKSGVRYCKNGGDAFGIYGGGIVGGTAWLFSRPEWSRQLDYLFVDEAGQVSLANAIAAARSAKNLVLLGDQMQLEQPVQGAHPGDSSMSVLQYALKNTAQSKEDAPAFHAVVPADQGLFLSVSRRMNPAVCRFISQSMYDGKLNSHVDCARQKLELPGGNGASIAHEAGVVFCGVEHEGNVQQSDEEVDKAVAIYRELLGRTYMDASSEARLLALDDFLFISPYNAQVRALQISLPEGARVGTVDKFQGQEAPVCILSLCSSYGEYGSRGLGFILDKNRMNVAISRAQCLAVVVADPRIASASASSIEEMELVNLFCKLTQSDSSAAVVA